MTTILVSLYAVSGALVLYIILKIKKNYSYWKLEGIPCEEPHFIFGNLKGVTKTHGFNDIWLQYYNKFRGTGPFAGFYWFFQRSVFVLDIALVKNILIKDFFNFTDRGFYSNEKDDPLTGHLFLLDGPKWKNLRNKLTPTFTSGKMKFMFPTVLDVGHQFVSVFTDMVMKDSVVEVKELAARFTTDVIGSCAFGIDCNSLKDPEAEFRIMGKKSLDDRRHGILGISFMSSFPQLARKLHFKQTPQHIEDFFFRIVRETIALREHNGIRRNDFMDLLIDMKNNKKINIGFDELRNLTVEEITAQASVFFSAGFETSSTTIGFALYELAQHIEIQQKAREEIKAVLKENGEDFTYDSLKSMKYFNQIISETLRLYTVLPILNRVCLNDYPVPGHPNYVIKKGMKVLIPASAIHRDEKYFPNPDVFDPDHFAPEKVKARDSVLWLPFGDGPRNCIGLRFGLMQTRLGLALLLKNFKFSVCPQTQIPIEFNKKNFLVGSNSGIFLKVELA